MKLERNLVVEFGGSDEYVGIAELDDDLNVDSNGDTKSSFNPGDTVRIRLHLSDNVEFDYAISTESSLIQNGKATRTLTDRVLFSNKEVDNLTNLEQSVVSTSNDITFFGRVGNPTVTENTVTGVKTFTAEDIGAVPYLADIVASYSVTLFSIEIPTYELGEDDSYPIGVVFYLKEA